MSTAEFIGHNEDLNATYDLIYIGAGYADNNQKAGDAGSNDVMNRDAHGYPDYNDALMDGLAYVHTGDYVYAWELLGQLDTSYEALDYSTAYMETLTNYAYESVAAGSPNLKTNWKTIGDDKIGNFGFFRYSGNDITKIKLAELRDYVQGNNPVIVSDDLISYNVGSGNAISQNRIDNSSYLFDFLNQEKAKPNVMTRSVAPINTSLINYVNIMKPVIEFMNNSGEVIVDHTSIATDGKLYHADYEYGEHIATFANGQFSTKFRVNNGKTDQTMQGQYVLKFFVDMNSDGKYIKSNESSELLQDFILTTGGKPATKNADGNYIIWSGKIYTLERSMPSNYVGILPWKLEIEQITNSKSRVSKIAYTKVPSHCYDEESNSCTSGDTFYWGK